MDFDFGDSAVVEVLEKVPEQFRPLYEAKDGKFAIKSSDPAVKGAVEAILGLNKALKAERAAKKPVVDITPLKDFGATPEEIKAKIDELQGQLATNAKVDVKKIKDELALQFKRDIDTKDSRIKALCESLNTHLIDSALKGAIASEKGDVDLLLPFARQRMKPVETEGGYGVAVVDEAGNVRYSGVTGQPMSPLELVKEMKVNPKYGRLFESEAPKGGGPRPGASSTAGSRPQASAETSAFDKIKKGLQTRALSR